MIIFGVCRSCNNRLPILTNVKTRVALTKEIDATSIINCRRCGVTNSFTVNDLKAQFPKKITQAVLEVLFVLLSLSLSVYAITQSALYFIIVLGLFLIPSLIYLSHIRKKRCQVISFNKSRI